jgi:hypothetical protein
MRRYRRRLRRGVRRAAPLQRRAERSRELQAR